MHDFIENNQRLLSIYSRAAQSIGRALVSFGAIFVVLSLVVPSPFRVAIPMAVVHGIFPGLMAMTIGQFIRYLLETDYQPGWMLRHGDKLLYLYAVLLVMNSVWVRIQAMGIREGVGLDYSPLASLMLQGLLGLICKVLILIGLGQILRRILPVIEESRTLV
jgi:hypothetical protein